MKKKKILIIVLSIIILALALNLILKNNPSQNETKECAIDSDCVPETCCHSNSCVPKEQAPNCEGAFCTMECRPNTMDCGAGKCSCIEGKCGVLWNEEFK